MQLHHPQKFVQFIFKLWKHWLDPISTKIRPIKWFCFVLVEFFWGYFVKKFKKKRFMNLFFEKKHLSLLQIKKLEKRKRKTKHWANEIDYLSRRSSHASHVCLLIGTHGHLASGCGFQYDTLATCYIIFRPIYSSIG